MTALIVSTLCLLGLPLLLLFLFKSNAAIMFFAACAGIVLLSSLDPSVVATAGALLPGEGEGYIRLSAVLLVLVFAALMFKGAVHKASGYLLHGVVVLMTSLMLWTTLPEKTGVSWLLDSTSQSVWRTLSDFQTFIIAFGFSLSLVVILKTRVKH